MRKDKKSSYNRWLNIMKQYEKEGLTISEFCQINQISRSTFYKWKRIIEKSEKIGDSKATAFIPIAISPEIVEKKSNLILNINGIQIEINNSTDENLLRKVVEVLK